MVVAWLTLAVLFGVLFRRTLRPWDHMISTSVVHFVLVCAVTGSFPTSTVWWVTFVAVALASALIPPLAGRWCDRYPNRLAPRGD